MVRPVHADWSLFCPRVIRNYNQHEKPVWNLGGIEMTRQELREAYYESLKRLFKTSPGSPDNIRASEACAALYDIDPELCDDVDDALGGGMSIATERDR